MMCMYDVRKFEVYEFMLMLMLFGSEVMAILRCFVVGVDLALDEHPLAQWFPAYLVYSTLK